MMRSIPDSTAATRPGWRIPEDGRSVSQPDGEKAPEPDRSCLSQAILALGTNAYPMQSLRLADSPFFRLRVDNWRVIYHALIEKETVLILKVARRSEQTYRGV